MSILAATPLVFAAAHPALVPAADLFATGTSLGDKATALCLGLAGAVIAWFLLKQLAKVNTFMGAFVAIAGGLVLFWFVRHVNSGDLNKPLDDTVKTVTTGMSSLHPAGDRATTFLDTGHLS